MAPSPGLEDRLLRKATLCDDIDGDTDQRAVQVTTGLAEQVEGVRGVHPIAGDQGADCHRNHAGVARWRVQEPLAEFTDQDPHHRGCGTGKSCRRTQIQIVKSTGVAGIETQSRSIRPGDRYLDAGHASHIRGGYGQFAEFWPAPVGGQVRHQHLARVRTHAGALPQLVLQPVQANRHVVGSSDGFRGPVGGHDRKAAVDVMVAVAELQSGQRHLLQGQVVAPRGARAGERGIFRCTLAGISEFQETIRNHGNASGDRPNASRFLEPPARLLYSTPGAANSLVFEGNSFRAGTPTHRTGRGPVPEGARCPDARH